MEQPLSHCFEQDKEAEPLPLCGFSLVVLLMNTLDRLIPERMSFQSPGSPQRHDRLLDAFIDDTLLGFTDHGLITLETMITN